MAGPTVTFQIVAGQSLEKGLNKEMVKSILKTLARRYRVFVSKRYDTNSLGGGEWPPLKPATIKRRRNGIKINPRKKEQKAIESNFQSATILVDMGLLRNAVNPVLHPNATEESKIEGSTATVTVGFAGRIHPPKKGEKPTGVTIAQIAEIHHYGNKKRNIPARPILVPPDAAERAFMEGVIQKEIKKAYGYK